MLDTLIEGDNVRRIGKIGLEKVATPRWQSMEDFDQSQVQRILHQSLSGGAGDVQLVAWAPKLEAEQEWSWVGIVYAEPSNEEDGKWEVATFAFFQKKDGTWTLGDGYYEMAHKDRVFFNEWARNQPNLSQEEVEDMEGWDPPPWMLFDTREEAVEAAKKACDDSGENLHYAVSESVKSIANQGLDNLQPPSWENIGSFKLSEVERILENAFPGLGPGVIAYEQYPEHDYVGIVYAASSGIRARNDLPEGEWTYHGGSFFYQNGAWFEGDGFESIAYDRLSDELEERWSKGKSQEEIDAAQDEFPEPWKRFKSRRELMRFARRLIPDPAAADTFVSESIKDLAHQGLDASLPPKWNHLSKATPDMAKRIVATQNINWNNVLAWQAVQGEEACRSHLSVAYIHPTTLQEGSDWYIVCEALFDGEDDSGLWAPGDAWYDAYDTLQEHALECYKELYPDDPKDVGGASDLDLSQDERDELLRWPNRDEALRAGRWFFPPTGEGPLRVE